MESSQERFEYLKSKNYTLKLLHEELGRDINIRDPLPAEPVLAEQLLCSRSEAREAIIILECFGYVSCRSRSNNIIVKNFNEPPNDTYQYFKKLYDSSEDFKKFYISLDGKYKEGDTQLILDAIKEVQKILGQFSGGGRAGYANGEMVEEQVTETETMAPGPMGDATNNLISYDQLRARLPAEITDDIVELIANSAEALEDFAMISDQSQVDQFNRKYSVNLVLPAEA